MVKYVCDEEQHKTLCIGCIGSRPEIASNYHHAGAGAKAEAPARSAPILEEETNKYSELYVSYRGVL